MLLAFVILFPFFLYKIISYLKPALFSHEKKLLLQSLIPSSLLFFIGCLFSYYYVIPTTFEVLYPYAIHLGVIPFFSLAEFTSSVFFGYYKIRLLEKSFSSRIFVIFGFYCYNYSRWDWYYHVFVVCSFNYALFFWILVD